MSTEQKTRYTLKATSTPLSKKNDKKAKSDLRLTQNEDDDLYDPYTDYHDGTLRKQTLEEDPWR